MSAEEIKNNSPCSLNLYLLNVTDDAGCTAGAYNTEVHSMMVAAANKEEAQKYHPNGLYESDGEQWVLVKNAEEKQKTIYLYEYRTLQECQDNLTRGWCSAKKTSKLETILLGTANKKWSEGVVFHCWINDGGNVEFT